MGILEGINRFFLGPDPPGEPGPFELARIAKEYRNMASPQQDAATRALRQVRSFAEAARRPATFPQGSQPSVLPPPRPMNPSTLGGTPVAANYLVPNGNGQALPSGTQPSPGSGFSWGDVLDRLGDAAIDYFLPPREAAQQQQLAAPQQSPSPCPGALQVRNPLTGSCVDLTALPPGGKPATYAAQGQAVMGSFGIPAMAPAVVGEINGAPIRRCVAGAVLGKDDLCYMKGSIPRQFRKWAPQAKPPVSAYDAKMMRKYGPGGSKQKRIKGLAMDAGFACRKK